MGTVVAIENGKGGVGKSTSVSNMSVGLQLQRFSVLIIDRDAGQRTTCNWRNNSQKNYPMVVSIDKPTLHSDIKKISDIYDYIIIDGASKAEQMAASSVKAADIVLIPVRPSGADIDGADTIVRLIKERQEITDGYPIAAFFINCNKKGTRLAKQVRSALLDRYNLPVFSNRISESVVYTECLQTGSSVFDVNTPEAKEKAIEMNLFIDELKEFYKCEKKRLNCLRNNPERSQAV